MLSKSCSARALIAARDRPLGNTRLGRVIEIADGDEAADAGARQAAADIVVARQPRISAAALSAA